MVIWILEKLTAPHGVNVGIAVGVPSHLIL